MDDLLDEAWGWLVDKLKDWALSTFETFLLWWMSDTAYYVRMTGEKGGVLYSLREHLNWMIAVMAFAGFMVAAFRIAVQRKGEPFRAALSQFVELAVIVLTLATAVNLANIAADRYSAWIIKDMMPEGGLAEKWDDGVGVLQLHENDANFIVACFALCAAVSTAIQFVLMLFRSGVLILLVGILPAVAASRFSSYGDAAYRKCMHWLIAFVLFKPVAATIYAAALKLLVSDNEADRLFGLALIAGAVFALPATMRAVMPGVAENNSFFGIRQVGHFTFGGTAVNVGKRTGIWTGLTGIGGGPSGGSGKGGNPGRHGVLVDGGAPGRGAPAPGGDVPTGARDDGGDGLDGGGGAPGGSGGAPDGSGGGPVPDGGGLTSRGGVPAGARDGGGDGPGGPGGPGGSAGDGSAGGGGNAPLNPLPNVDPLAPPPSDRAGPYGPSLPDGSSVPDDGPSGIR
ncbi:hypothetical protein [Actinomadura madurae]|uniref:hypothetical protein n=1 Tax=Actinomadura madurae TaxID=1993 RepID=UPI0026E5253F|nr:hypothetical protein [Actinomadura madurae]